MIAENGALPMPTVYTMEAICQWWGLLSYDQ